MKVFDNGLVTMVVMFAYIAGWWLGLLVGRMQRKNNEIESQRKRQGEKS